MCLEKSLAAIRSLREMGLPVTDERLCSLAGEVYDHLQLHDFRSLRRAIRDMEHMEREALHDIETELIPPDWQWWSQTVGRRAHMVGGDVTETRRIQIERAFGLSTLLWSPFSDTSEDGRLPGERQEGSAVDLLLLVEAEQEPVLARSVLKAAMEMGIPCTHQCGRASVIRTRTAIERYIQPDPPMPART